MGAEEHLPSRSLPAATAAGGLALRLTGAATAALGLLALAGWAFDLPSVRTLGAGYIPMAPSTAALFVLHGLGLFGRAQPRPSRRRLTASLVAAGLAGLVALALLVLAGFGVRTTAEHLALPVTGELHGAPLGHMSPLTAVCFLLASLSALASLPAPAGRPWRRPLALTTAGLLLGAGAVLLLAYLYGRPLLYGGALIPPALNTSLAFLTLALGLLALTGRQPAPHERVPHQARDLGLLLAGFALLAAAVVGAGYVYYRGYEAQYRREVERQVAAVARLEVRELTRWRAERLHDGAVFLGNRGFAALVRRYRAAPADPAAQDAVFEWLQRVRAAHGYDRVALLAEDGTERLAAPAPAVPAPPAPEVVQNVAAALAEGRVRFVDFHRDAPDGPVHLAVMVPLRGTDPEGRPLGVLLLRIDPTTDVFPLLGDWPTPSGTAETLLVRPEGDAVVFLSPPRFHPGPPLSLRLPLALPTLPAAQAALGREGSLEGLDYRGVPVVAELLRVPDTPWALVARMDVAEVYAPLGARVWQLALTVALLLAGAGAGLGLLWRQRSVQHYRTELAAAAALRESERALRDRNDELTRFTYTVSHDLKSPLVTIRTFVDFLEQDVAGGDAAAIGRDMGFIRTAADRMARLLDELLELSRVGRTADAPEAVPLAAVAREALELVAGRIARRGVRVELTDEPVVLFGERRRLVEVFQNLVDNAVKFMGEQADPWIRIGVERTPEGVELFVRDNGIGIDPRHQPRVFGLFEKLDPGGEGTGIGLALVRRIVEVHGGRIRVESDGPGTGTCFRFTLARTAVATAAGREGSA